MNKYNQIFWQEKQHQIQISKYLLLMLIISATVIHIGKNNNNWKLHDMIIDSDTKFNKKKKIGMKLKKNWNKAIDHTRIYISLSLIFFDMNMTSSSLLLLSSSSYVYVIGQSLNWDNVFKKSFANFNFFLKMKKSSSLINSERKKLSNNNAFKEFIHLDDYPLTAAAAIWWSSMIITQKEKKFHQKKPKPQIFWHHSEKKSDKTYKKKLIEFLC
mgnify:CR=1 FL=1